MGVLISTSEHKRYVLFLNISFLLVACVFSIMQFNSVEFLVLRSSQPFKENVQHDCKSLHSLDDYKAKCFYLKSNTPCVSQGYIDYLYLFYCNFGRFPLLGYCLLFLWLLVLFYLLGNTASEYFCSSLENLSKLWNLSPAIAGVTLLSLGNGAPDVFASLVSFMGDGTSDVGFSTVLGGALVVTCVVLGSISISVRKNQFTVGRCAFIRDVCFFLLVLVSLFFILIYGKINLWGALGFLLMYLVYVMIVYISQIHWTSGGYENERYANASHGCDLSVPILSSLEKGEQDYLKEGGLDCGTKLEMKNCCFCVGLSAPCGIVLRIIEMPLDLPRRLTVPVVCEKRWSKPTAVASLTLAPVLLSALWNAQDENATFNSSLVAYGIGFMFGITFGVLGYATTEKSSPPKKCLLPWLAGGFIMSVTWSYIIAQELVGLLVSLGYVFGISPSVLGLTVLAWGNSLGDLVTNSILAVNGGPEGVQVAVSGCFGGPIFNVLFGLGLSLVGSAWCAYPSYVVIQRDEYLLETIGFLAGGLLWALAVLPRRNMRPDGLLGGGLLAIYLMSLSLRLIQTLGYLHLFQ